MINSIYKQGPTGIKVSAALAMSLNIYLVKLYLILTFTLLDFELP